MNQEQAQKILNIAYKFCKDNDGNKINEWSTKTFLEVLKQELLGVIQGDIKEQTELQKRMDEQKKLNTSEEKSDPVRVLKYKRNPDEPKQVSEATQEEVLNEIKEEVSEVD